MSAALSYSLLDLGKITLQDLHPETVLCLPNSLISPYPETLDSCNLKSESKYAANQLKLC